LVLTALVNGLSEYKPIRHVVCAVAYVAIGGSAGSRNRGSRPLGAPDRGHNLFYLQDSRKPGFRRNRNPLIGFLKDAPSAHLYIVHSYFLFPKTLSDSSDEEIIGNNGCDLCKKKYSDVISDDEWSL